MKKLLRYPLIISLFVAVLPLAILLSLIDTLKEEPETDDEKLWRQSW